MGINYADTHTHTCTHAVICQVYMYITFLCTTRNYNDKIELVFSVDAVCKRSWGAGEGEIYDISAADDNMERKKVDLLFCLFVS